MVRRWKGKVAVVRVDNWLLFPDGRGRKLTIRERFYLRRGKKLVANLSTMKTRKING